MPVEYLSCIIEGNWRFLLPQPPIQTVVNIDSSLKVATHARKPLFRTLSVVWLLWVLSSQRKSSGSSTSTARACWTRGRLFQYLLCDSAGTLDELPLGEAVGGGDLQGPGLLDQVNAAVAQLLHAGLDLEANLDRSAGLGYIYILIIYAFIQSAQQNACN